MTSRFSLPSGACDSHLHVFGPYETFPLAAERSYEPPYAPFERLIAMLDAQALDRAVLVQPSAYGADHSALLDALRRAPQRLRGIAVLQPQDAQALSDAALDAMHAAGVRGLRFTDASAAAFKGNVGIEALPALASRLRQRGWHAQVWMGCRALLEAMPLLQAAQLPVVVDHMGRFDVQAGIKGADFVELCAALADGGAQGWLWVKLSLCRATPDFPDYAQARPFHDALVLGLKAQRAGSDNPLTVLLVEHDMDAVFRLADRISVLVQGRLIATDAPASIKRNAEVRKAYLGDELDDAHGEAHGEAHSSHGAPA